MKDNICVLLQGLYVPAVGPHPGAVLAPVAQLAHPGEGGGGDCDGLEEHGPDHALIEARGREGALVG